jgi:DNA-binding Lrp family transcriptional regulator
MTITAEDRRLLAAIQNGLPLVSRPYAAIGAQVGLSEAEVIAALRGLRGQGVIKRFGVIVRHHELGYRANAMVVFDIPDEQVRAAGERLATLPFVTLCYRRPRRPPLWPYNLFCMIHGQDRAVVLEQIAQASAAAGLDGVARAVLFSARRFKQQGARYGLPARSEAA